MKMRSRSYLFLDPLAVVRPELLPFVRLPLRPPARARSPGAAAARGVCFEGDHRGPGIVEEALPRQFLEVLELVPGEHLVGVAERAGGIFVAHRPPLRARVLLVADDRVRLVRRHLVLAEDRVRHLYPLLRPPPAGGGLLRLQEVALPLLLVPLFGPVLFGLARVAHPLPPPLFDVHVQLRQRGLFEALRPQLAPFRVAVDPAHLLDPVHERLGHRVHREHFVRVALALTVPRDGDQPVF
mmetsp:Transcript_15599/g.31088  ORF Transcript_15599/g.31088 Transcript_15599/m.31088 type:complete len:240 (-) Transcript_15599:1543-2262(-)